MNFCGSLFYEILIVCLDHQIAVLYLLPYIIPAGRKSKPKKAEIQGDSEATEDAESRTEPVKRISVRQNAFNVIVPISLVNFTSKL